MNSFSHALLADVLTSIENASGIPLGTAAYLQVQELMSQLPDDTRPEELKTLLAPLLCRSQEEQEQFYEIFKKSWERVQETGELEPEVIEQVETEIQVEARKRKWGALTWYILLPVAAIGAFLLWRQSNPERIKPTRVIKEARVGESGQYAVALRSPSEDFLNERPQQDSATACVRWDSIGAIHPSEKDPGVYYANVHYTALRAGIDSFNIQIKPDIGSFRRRYTIVFNVTDSLAAAPPPQETEQPEARDTILYQVRDIPHARDLSQLDPPQPTAWQRFLMDYEWLLKIAFMLLCGLLLWWLARRFEQKRRRLIAEHQPNVKPPYTWNISLGPEPDVAFSEDFYALLLQLRRRESDELWRLDVPRTVRATVDKGGMPEFRYVQQTRPAEYLLLIDRQSGRDHQARLFDLMYRAFRSQEVLVERYWYDEGDPRRCYNEAHPTGLSLRDLQYYHPQSRVVLLGNAYALLHPGTGSLSKWALQTFSAWSDRAVLSTQPLSAFGRRERNLQELFHVMPVSLSGLRDVIELFDADEGKMPDLNPRRFPDAAQQPMQLIDNDLIKTIQSASPDTQTGTDGEKFIDHHSSFIIWVAACAIYPELHWDLTLQLGHLIDSMPSGTATPISPATDPSHASRLPSHALTPLTSHLSLQSLTRLPWFSEGEMPLEVRQILLAWLEREHPEINYKLREGLHRLLAQNPPPAGSAAYDDYAMNLALNEWLYTRDAVRKKELQRDIAARLAAGQQADFMVLRMLDPGNSLTPEQFEVPDDWKKHLREKGHAFLNPRRAWWWAVPIWLVLCGLALWWQPERVECGGLQEVYKGKEYCIENFEEWAVFREIVFFENLKTEETAIADSLLNVTISAGWENWTLKQEIHKDALVDEAEFYVDGKNQLTGRPNVNDSTELRNFNAITELRRKFNQLVNENIPGINLDKDNPYIDSTSFLQNAAVAYFNEGVKIHVAYSSMWETVEQSGQKPVGANYRPRSEACAYFTQAQEINDLLPDTLQFWFVRDAAKCGLPVVRQSSQPVEQKIKDITISGQLNNASTKRSLYLNEWMSTKIEAKGLRPANISRGAFFSLRIPGNRQAPVDLTITVPGYETQRLTVRPADFKKEIIISLNPLVKCYEQLRAQGITLTNKKNYESAVTMFTTASQCADAPEKNDLRDLIEKAGKLALTEQQEQQRNEQAVRDKADEQKRLDTEREANADDDGDGVPNKDDQCPNEKGTAAYKGCPPPAPSGKDLAAVLAEIDANMVNVSGGTFRMGCDDKMDGDCGNDEKPVHPVQLTTFEMSKFEVTQEQWKAVMGANPSGFKNCDNCPVEQVIWEDIQVFITKLNTLSGKKYRLPTEAEWEFAARGGTKSRNFKYAGSNKLEEVAWFNDNAGNKTHPVGAKKSNEMGLFDMSGNVWEWCSDWFGEYNLGKITVNNPQGSEKGSGRVLRGGSWYYGPQGCRVAVRFSGAPGYRSGDVGFRLARTK